MHQDITPIPCRPWTLNGLSKAGGARAPRLPGE
jgi:hypothetical protein